MILSGRVLHVNISRYGKKLIKDLEADDFSAHESADVPLVFGFNSSWKMEHDCLSCDGVVTVDQNFDKNESNLSVLKSIDSSNYSRDFLDEIATVFDTVELVEVDDVFYLNRTDFQYDFDFQRTSSVDLTHYCCASCKSDYLALIRVGFPMSPERGMEQGRAGRLEVAEIVMVSSVNGFKEQLEIE